MEITFTNAYSTDTFKRLLIGQTFITAKAEDLSDVRVIWIKHSETAARSMETMASTSIDPEFKVYKVVIKSAVVKITG